MTSIENKTELSDEELRIFANIINLGSFAKYHEHSSYRDPDFESVHEEMRVLLIDAHLLPERALIMAKPYISHMVQTLHMSRGDYESALREIYQNDPKGKEYLESAFRVMADVFQNEFGLAALPKDFLHGGL